MNRNMKEKNIIIMNCPMKATMNIMQLTQTPPLRIPRRTWSGMMSLE